MKNNTKKQDIIKAYAKVIEKQGLEGASLGAVADQMGINKSLIFHYFESKDDLLYKLTQYVADLCIKAYDNAWPSDGVLTKHSFEQYVEYILEIHQKRKRTVSPKLYFSITYSMPRHKEIQVIFTKLAGDLVEKIASNLSHFADKGIIAPQNMVLSARTLLCLADGILCYDQLTPEAERPGFVAAQKDLFLMSVGFNRY